MIKNFKIIVGIVSIVLLFATHANAWGEEGHAIVADIASSLLTTKATTAVSKYIPGEKMSSVSSVADTFDHSAEGKWSEPMHYINMLRNQTVFNAAINCKNLCVVGAIQNYTKRLQANYTATLIAEPSALVFIIHFVGDVHQPLHVGWADDLGGNTIKVQFYGVKTELHAVWDDNIIEKYNKDWVSFSAELKTTIKTNSTIIKQYTKNMDPISWANESFDYTKSDVYVGVSGVDPNLTDDYYNRNIPIVKERLMAAGIRLATLLNSIFV